LLQRLQVVGVTVHGHVQAEPVDVGAQRLLEVLLSAGIAFCTVSTF
jgi:hypothetical protein